METYDEKIRWSKIWRYCPFKSVSMGQARLNPQLSEGYFWSLLRSDDFLPFLRKGKYGNVKRKCDVSCGLSVQGGRGIVVEYFASQ